MIFVREDREEGESRGFDRGNGMDRGNSHRHVQMPSNNHGQVSILLECVSMYFTVFCSILFFPISSAMVTNTANTADTFTHTHTHTHTYTHTHTHTCSISNLHKLCTVSRRIYVPSHSSIPPYSSTHSHMP